MPRAYSVDLRERSLQALASGLSTTEVAHVFGVSRSSLFRWRQQQQATGQLLPGRSPGRPRAIAATQEPTLVAQVAAEPDATLAEHCAQWAAQQGVTVSPPTMGRTLQRLGLPLKKRP